MQKDLTPEALEENTTIIKDIVDKYISGYRIIDIARFYHITYYKCRKVLLDNNVRIRNKNEKI